VGACAHEHDGFARAGGAGGRHPGGAQVQDLAAGDAGGALSAARVRPARASDFEAVLELWAQARSVAAVTPDDEHALARLFERDPGALLVAELDRRVVGAVVAGWDGWRGNMYRLAVLPEQRRRGIGRQLVEAGHELLRATGARRVSAIVADDETEAAALWIALGYERDSHLSRYVRNI
jgi:ribosomal protein S18 acetylase RimI-like enzyme